MSLTNATVTTHTRSRVPRIAAIGGGSVQRYTTVILGAGGVGKSALVVRYGQNIFLDQYNPTIEEEYDLTVTTHDGQRSHLQVIDTAGEDQFTRIDESYIQRGCGFVLVFSLTEKASLKEVTNIRQQIYQIKGGEKDIPMVVVGTKLDLTGEREISRGTVEDFAAQWGLEVFETSAKKGWHVNEPFNTLVETMRKRYPDGQPGTRKRKRDQCMIM